MFHPKSNIQVFLINSIVFPGPGYAVYPLCVPDQPMKNQYVYWGFLIHHPAGTSEILHIIYKFFSENSCWRSEDK